MSIEQKNMFGDNIIYQFSPNYTRNLNDTLKKEIITILNEIDVESVVIRVEQGGETIEFAKIVAQFLIEEGFNVSQIISVMGSEIQRHEFSIQKHPSDKTFAIIKIGPVI